METTIEKGVRRLELDEKLLQRSVLLFRAINHKLRQQVLWYIHEKKEATVTEIYIRFRLEQSITSQHLAILRKQGFVKTRRDGKCIYYSVNYMKLSNVHEISRQLTGANS